MINLEKTPEQVITKTIARVKRKNRKNWLTKVDAILEGWGYRVDRFTVCSRGHSSGKVTRVSKNRVRVYSYGTAIKARTGFNYNIYPVLEINLK